MNDPPSSTGVPDWATCLQQTGWELDTIIGKGHKQALVSLTERKSRLTLIARVASKEADTVKTAILQQLAPLSDNVHTLTSDNGREFARHQAIAKALNATFYFAHPRLQRVGLCLLATRTQRKYQRPDTPILPQEQRLYHHH